MKHAACHPSDAQNFEVASRFLENVCTPDLRDSTAYVVQGTTINQFKNDPLLCKQKRDYKIYKKGYNKNHINKSVTINTYIISLFNSNYFKKYPDKKTGNFNCYH